MNKNISLTAIAATTQPVQPLDIQEFQEKLDEKIQHGKKICRRCLQIAKAASRAATRQGTSKGLLEARACKKLAREAEKELNELQLSGLSLLVKLQRRAELHQSAAGLMISDFQEEVGYLEEILEISKEKAQNLGVYPG